MSYLRYLCLFAYSGVQHILCCVLVVCLCLVHSGVQHILCCVFCFVCICVVSCVSNVASFSGLSIFDCPLGIL
jgi:hypothetical protein